jgi:hypothetical protein
MIPVLLVVFFEVDLFNKIETFSQLLLYKTVNKSNVDSDSRFEPIQVYQFNYPAQLWMKVNASFVVLDFILPVCPDHSRMGVQS